MKSNIIRRFVLLCIVLLSLAGCINTQNNNEENKSDGSENGSDLPVCGTNHNYTTL